MAKIYVSSTYSDLSEYREAVYRALRKIRHDVISMKDHVATDQRPLDKCMDDIAACDLCVGIFAWRCGHILDQNNPTQPVLLNRQMYHKIISRAVGNQRLHANRRQYIEL